MLSQPLLGWTPLSAIVQTRVRDETRLALVQALVCFMEQALYRSATDEIRLAQYVYEVSRSPCYQSALHRQTCDVFGVASLTR